MKKLKKPILAGKLVFPAGTKVKHVIRRLRKEYKNISKDKDGG